MGTLCELFVAKHGDALKFEGRLETAAPPHYERGEAKGLLPIAFEVLWAVMERQVFDPHRHTLPDLYFWSHASSGIGRVRQRLAVWKAMALAAVGKDIGNTWLHRFPDSLVSQLASMTDAQAIDVAENWARTEELMKARSEIAGEALTTLRMLARTAIDSDRGLYLWGSV